LIVAVEMISHCNMDELSGGEVPLKLLVALVPLKLLVALDSVGVLPWLVVWHTGRTSVFHRRTFPVNLKLMGDHLCG